MKIARRPLIVLLRLSTVADAKKQKVNVKDCDEAKIQTENSMCEVVECCK